MKIDRKLHWINNQIEKIERGEDSHIRLFDLPLELIPSKVWDLKAITGVSIYNYREKKLLSKIEEFEKISSLSIIGSSITELKAFGRLKEIDTLYISKVPRNFSFSNFDYLKSLTFSDSEIKKIPKAIFASRDLESLKLESLEFNKFPKDFFNLNNLRELALNNLQNIENLTSNFHQFANLRSLKLDNSNIIEIPQSIFDLKKLEILSITNHKTKIPKDIARLNNLSALVLTLNDTDIPDYIYNFTKLESLILYGNKFEQIKAPIKNLKNLSWLEIYNEGNEEQALIVSEELLKLPLKIIDITGFSLDKNTAPIKKILTKSID